MAITRVQTKTQGNNSATTIVGAFASNVTAGNVIIISVSTAATAVSTITDTQSNTYKKIDRASTGTGVQPWNELWYAENITGGACTITVNMTSANGAFIAREYSGLATGGLSVVGKNSGTAVASLQNGIHGSTPTDDCLMFAGYGTGTGGTTWTVDNSFGNSDTATSTGASNSALVGISDKISTAIEDVQLTITPSASVNVQTVMLCWRSNRETNFRKYYHHIADSSSTWNTNTTYQMKARTTFFPEASATYLIMGSALLGSSSNSNLNRPKLKIRKTTATTADWSEIDPVISVVNTEYVSWSGATIFTASATPTVPETFEINFGTTATAGTAEVKNARLVVIKLGSSDQQNSSVTRITTSLATMQDALTKTWTPGSAGDYLVMGWGVVDSNNLATDLVEATLDIDGTEYGTIAKTGRTGTSANQYPFFAFKKVNLTAASHTVKVKYRITNTASIAGIASMVLVAFRLSDFYNNYSAEDQTRTTTTSSTYQDKTTLTQTPANKMHLQLAASVRDHNLTGSTAQGGQFVRGATVLFEETETVNLVTTEKHGSYGMIIEELAASSTTWKTQYKSNATQTAGIDESTIIILQLDSSGSLQTLTLAATMVGVAVADDRIIRRMSLIVATLVSVAIADILKKFKALLVVTVVSGVISNRLTKIYKLIAAAVYAVATDLVTAKFVRTLGAIEVAIATLAKAKQSPVTLAATEISIQTLARVSKFFRTIAAQAVSIATLNRLTKFFKGLAATELSIATIVKRVGKPLTVITVTIPSLVAKAMYARALSVIATTLPSLTAVKQFARSLAVTVVTAPALVRLAQFFRILSAQAVSTAIIGRRIGKTLSVIVFTIATLSLKSTYARLLSVIEASIPTLTAAKQYARPLAATELSIATLSLFRKFYRSLSVIEVAIATISLFKKFYRPLAATELSITTLSLFRKFYRSLSVIEVAIATIANRITRLQSLAAQAVTIPALFLASIFYKNIAAAAASIATLAAQRFYLRTLAAQAASIATLAMFKAFFRTLAAQAASIATLANRLTFTKFLSAVEVSIATISRMATYYRTLAATEVSIATIAARMKAFITLASTSLSVATLAARRLYYRTLSVIATTVPTVAIQRMFKRSLVATAITIAVLSIRLSLFVTLTATAVSNSSIVRTAKHYVTLAAQAVSLAVIILGARIFPYKNKQYYERKEGAYAKNIKYTKRNPYQQRDGYDPFIRG